MINRPFPQISTLNESRFDRFLRHRGISIGRHGIKQAVSLAIIQSLDADVPTFHPFQVWPLAQFLRTALLDLTSRFESKSIINPPETSRNTRPASNIQQDLGFRRAQERCHIFHNHILPLLFYLEAYYIPIVRSQRPGYVRLSNCDQLDWLNWKRNTPPKQFLQTHRISDEEVISIRRRILLDAEKIDPSPNLYLLLRSISFTQRQKFRGMLRLAHDLYEIAEIMRYFLEDISGDPVTKEWDPRGQPDTLWVESLYGIQPRFGDPNFLRPLIRQYGLDPTLRVLWLVEGDTEIGFISQYARRMGLDIDEYIELRNFGGDSAFQKQLKFVDEELQFTRREQRFVTLTFDDTTRSRRRLTSLVGEGLINMRFTMNKPDFEADNFTPQQLVHVAVTWANDLQYSIATTEATLASEVAQKMGGERMDFKRAFNGVLCAKGESFRLTKNKEWGIRLADFAFDLRVSEPQADDFDEDQVSKIERQIQYVMHGSQPIISYPISVEDIDITKLEIL